jgi:hypothetical protein
MNRSSALSPLLLLLIIVFLLVPLTLLAQGNSPNGGTQPAAVEESFSVYLPFAFNRHDTQFPASLFGVQMYGSSGLNSPYYPYLVDSKAGWLRTRILWESVVPTPRPVEEYVWGAADQMVAAARADLGGLNLIVVLGDVLPPWARMYPNRHYGPMSPEMLDDFAKFVGAVVERYDGDGYQDAPGSPVVKHWELGNEPDSSRDSWGDYGGQYAVMLQVAYTAIKQADPGAQVALGGLAYDWFTTQGGPFNEAFLDDVLLAGGGQYFDIMNFHIYPLFAPRWGSESTGLREKTAVIRDKLASYGLNKPVIITEAGWYDSTPSNSDEQVTRLVQLFAQSFAADIKVTIWWMLYDPGGYFQGFGLVTNNNPPQPKPAFTAYQTAYNLLGGTLATRTLSLAETGTTKMEAYRFQTATKGVVYVAWLNPYTTTETKPLRLPASRITVLNMFGDQISSITDLDGDGFITVNIGRQPVYLLVN